MNRKGYEMTPSACLFLLLRKDLKTYSVDIPVERELIDRETDALLAGDELRIKLFRIAHTFTPSVDQSKKFLEDARKNTPLLTLITQNIVTADGQTTARIGSLDEDPEGRLQKQTADLIGMLQMFLSHSLSELKSRCNPTADEIVTVVYECPLFTERRRTLITKGVTAYLKEDWVKAIHVLIPQIEECLRNLLAEIGVPVYKTGRAGTMDVKNMADVLADLRLRQVLGEDRWRYLSALFIDRRGLNMRNQVAHGLVNPEGFNVFTADLVLHSLITISTLRKVDEEPGSEPDEPAQVA
jgi:hypothetical protein